tara:strand:- start:1018 stop:1416 length:399 start_codon:yes stop_codon:yes gene_type:complete
MILPNNFDVTPFALSNLKPKQRKFVEFLMEEAGHTNANEVVFKRNYLKNIANAFGAEWAPAWIVKDMSRVTKRGFYAIPELAELIDEMSVVNGTCVAVEDAVVMAEETIADDMDDSISVSSDDMVDATTVVV